MSVKEQRKCQLWLGDMGKVVHWEQVKMWINPHQWLWLDS